MLSLRSREVFYETVDRSDVLVDVYVGRLFIRTGAWGKCERPVDAAEQHDAWRPNTA